MVGKKLNKDELIFFNENWRTMSDRDIASELNIKQYSDTNWVPDNIKKHRLKNNLHRTPAEVKGLIETNIKKGRHSIEGLKEHQFKNTRKEGELWIGKDGDRKWYLCKINGKIVKYHVWLWEQKYGKVPAGHVLRCKTENTLNYDPENWMQITRLQNRTMNMPPKEVMIKRLGEISRAYQAVKKDIKKHGAKGNFYADMRRKGYEMIRIDEKTIKFTKKK